MKVIFLDIDGVLNCQTTKERHKGMLGIDQKMVKIFNNIIKETGAKVVLSSTWRHDPNWQEVMKENGLECEFLGRTVEYLPGATLRGQEIEAWLDSHLEVNKYIIIDDDSDMLPEQKLFQTKFKTGLTQKIAKEIIKYLNSEEK